MNNLTFFKENIIKQENIDEFIDDDLDLLKFLAKQNLKTKLFWISDKSQKNLPQNIIHIKSIAELSNKYVERT